MDYNALKVADLKGLLKERGIPSTGLSRKQQIVEALESHDANGDGAPAQDEGTSADAAGTQEAEVAEAELGNDQGTEDASAENGARDEATGEEVKESESQGATPANSQPAADTQASNASAVPAASSQPTVLEANQPVSKEPSALTTPRQASPTGESGSSDRKRKRRSPTPPVDEETVTKKLKAADEGITTFPEGGQHGEAVMTDVPSEDIASKTMEADDADVAMSVPAQLDDGTADLPDTVEKSLHPPTHAIYISNLVRPVQVGQLSDYLTELAAGPGDSVNPGQLEDLHLGSIRTHAFAIFTSVPTAIQVRSRLHRRVWPDEPARKELWVDFVPDDKVRDWIARETEGGKRDTRRWEVLYDETDDGVVARHEEANAGPGQPERRPSNISASGQGLGMPNAPLGPRGTRPSNPAIPPAALPKQATPVPTSSASFVVLDEKFPSTTAKPKLYFLPIGKELADRRLDELERSTSREWAARGAELAMGDVRRYTFEDGDRIVDGGPHYDDFSGPRGGGGRRRGGGGFRGRR